MLCIYRSKANFAENMANNVKKESKKYRHQPLNASSVWYV